MYLAFDNKLYLSFQQLAAVCLECMGRRLVRAGFDCFCAFFVHQFKTFTDWMNTKGPIRFVTLASHQLATDSRYASWRLTVLLPELVRSKAKQCRPPSAAVLLYYFSVKISSTSDKTATVAASTPVTNQWAATRRFPFSGRLLLFFSAT